MHYATKRILFVALLSACFVASAQDSAVPSRITHYEAPGNLQPTHTLDCIRPDEILDTYTPADLYPAAASCIAQNRTDDAIYLYVVAGAYGQYDALRVADKSAHDAPMLLRMRAFTPVGMERMQQFNAKLLPFLQDDVKHLALCHKLLHLGPPRYFPRYMTQHGMSAFTSPGATDQVQDIDPVTNWLQIMKGYVKCVVVLPKSG
jgi:hypothetical protein